MMVTSSNNEAAELVGVGSHSQRSNSLSQTGQTQYTPFYCPLAPLPYVQLKTEKMAQDNYTIQALLTVLTNTHNVSTYCIIKSKFSIIPLTNSYCTLF